MIKKFALFYLLTFLFFSLAPINIFAAGEYSKIILIVNQVRGVECCDVGSEKFLMQQIDAVMTSDLKGNFSVRYDALTNPAFANILKNLDRQQFELGAFLEITPQLALDAGVRYSGDEAEWYKAQNVYTVGYEFENRKKIIDKYMERFYSVFGYYPKFSTAWIMDTDSVNYMNQEYGIFTHQITREQWGTDSYTMSGGPVHYPYFASKNWLFVNGGVSDEVNNNRQILVLRQTGSDPLFNYGDNTNSFTTQPNDYAIGNRGFDYFRNLKTQLVNQRQNNYGFLLLGLENSMVERYQDEYSKQINSIKDDGEIITMTVSKFNQYAQKNVQKVVGLEGDEIIKNTGEKSFWINAKNYRARFVYKDHKLTLSDLRVVNENLEDPYNTYVADDLAFWVTPFIFNASQQYSLKAPTNLTFKESFLNNLREKYLPEFQESNFEMKSSKNDFSTFFDGIIIDRDIDEAPRFFRNENGELVLRWIDEKKNKKEIVFYEGLMKTNFEISSKDLVLEQSEFLKFKKKWQGFELVFNDKKSEDESLSLRVGCSSGECDLSFNQLSNQSFSQLREDYYPYFFPEITVRDMDNAKSVFYAHNRYAVVGKNPVRFVFIPKDDKGFATNYQIEPEIFVSPDSKEADLHEKQANGTTFLDINSDETGKFKVKFLVDDLVEKNETVYFAPDCKNNLAYCMFHPVESIWYLSSMFYTKLRNF